jgi:helix-turn-helix protein
MAENTPGAAQPYSGKLRFDYIKGNHFRVIHVDGVHGGVRPNGSTIHMALFSERNAIPQSEEVEVENGRVGKVTSREGRQSVIREVEVDAIMDIGAARALRDWLSQMIQIAEAPHEGTEGGK